MNLTLRYHLITIFLLFVSGLPLLQSAWADTHYVAIDNPTPSGSYTTWGTAATSIQEAIDAAVAGDTVLVSNGVYATGGRTTGGSSLTNRVVIDKAITVQSVNGAGDTTIQGAKDPLITNGNAAVRCVWLGTNATLAGFTLTNGATRALGSGGTEDGSGGGIYAESVYQSVVSNCTIVGNSAGLVGGGVHQGLLFYCTLKNNDAGFGGGGASSSELNFCTVSGNTAGSFGGGAYFVNLNGCLLSFNTSDRKGGGAYYSTLNLCTVSGNTSLLEGGGTHSCTQNFSWIRGNVGVTGGGSYEGVLNNCLVRDNTADFGGGSYNATLNNCTVVRNSALSGNGGGANSGTLKNCIVYFNTNTVGGADNFAGSETFSSSCTTPDPGGTGNITNDPMFVAVASNDFHLINPASPCVESGNNTYAPPGTDIGGSPRIVNSFVDMGAYEAPPYILVQSTTGGTASGTGYHTPTVNLEISATPDNIHWTFGSWNDGNTDLPRTIVVPASDTTYTATFIENTNAVIAYVAITSTNPVPPYATWATAATNIQDAVDLTGGGYGDTVIVSNGVYQTGGRAATGLQLINRVTIDRAVSVESVNGPGSTFIQGAKDPLTTNGNAAVRCVWMATGAELSGFTLTNGATHATTGEDGYGGGLYAQSTLAIVSNCTISGNSAYSSGGGSYQGRLWRSTLKGNTAAIGGGAYNAQLLLSTLKDNSANFGGGASGGTILGCLLTGNMAVNDGGGAYQAFLNGCTISLNTADEGGGTYNSTVTSSWVRANTAISTGGGTYGGTVDATSISNNTANVGGGSALGVLKNCSIVGNMAAAGGGAYQGSLTNCDVSDNTASSNGGGAYQATLVNSIVSGNSAGTGGGGAYFGTLVNCSVAGNSASNSLGGVGWATVRNSVVYFNTAPTSPNRDGTSSFTYTCTTPLPVGTGNITNNPQFVDAANGNYRLSPGSPAINAGLNGYISHTNDFDGNPRVINGTVDMGAFEAPPYVSVSVSATGGVAIGSDSYFVGSNAVISATGNNAHWTFNGWNDGNTNVMRVITVPTTNISYSASFTETIFTAVTAHVAVANTAPVWPYDTWAKAATNIQDAIDILIDGDTVLVSNGVYDVGGRIAPGGALTNRVVIDKAIDVRSVNGPELSVITGAKDPVTTNGNQSVRGVWMGTNAMLSGFTVTEGSTGGSGVPSDERSGGGIHATSSSMVSNCIFSGNSAAENGGGISGGMTFNSTFTDNHAYFGGAAGGFANPPTLNHCTITSNTAFLGGGTYNAVLNNCLVTGNTAGNDGGGVYYGTINHCTVVGNTAAQSGGGFYNFSSADTATNSIIYFNTSGTTASNWFTSSTIHFSCTAPMGGGSGNIASAPNFVDAANGDFRLRINSPCLDVGTNGVVAGTVDLDGNPRLFNGVADMGAYEVQILPSDVFVDIGSTNPIFPYVSWATAATNIQQGIDAAGTGVTVYVSDGVYDTGGQVADGALTNRVVIDKAITVLGVSGPGSTFIVGAADPSTGSNGLAAVRCVWMTHTATLVGFTLTNGYARLTGPFNDSAGAGVYCPIVGGNISNCVITGNSALYGGGSHQGTLTHCTFSGNTGYSGGASYDSILKICRLTGNRAHEGGGSYLGTLNNCLLTDNMADLYGGGSYQGTLNNCTVTRNTTTGSSSGGGTYGGTINNSIVYFNTNTAGFVQNSFSGTFDHSCSIPLPFGSNNITNDPQFVDATSSNFHLSVSSPCIDTGSNAFVVLSFDLDGNPRIINGTVDMGAYEYQGVVNPDSDGDGSSDAEELIAGTNPGDSNSFFRITGILGGSSFTVDSVTGRVYAADYNEDLLAIPHFWIEYTNDIPGTGGPLSIPILMGASNRYFRGRVQLAP